MGQIELFNHLLYLKPSNNVQIELLVLDSKLFNCVQTNVNYKLFAYKSYNRIWH